MNIRLLIRITSLIVVCFLLSCGRKTAPEAPEDRAPKTVTEFQLKGLNAGVQLTWLAPSQNLKGEELLELEGFSIMRREYELASDNDFEIIANITAKNKSNSYSYVDTKTKNGKTYDYVVAAVNVEGIEGERTSVGRVVFSGVDSKVSITPNIVEIE